MSKENVVRMVELARDHVEKSGIRAAEVYYRMILKATEQPTRGIDRIASGEANAFFAARAIANGRHGEACDWYQRAVFADPLCVDHRINYIVKAMLPMNMFKNAKIEATRATRIEPDNKDAWRALAIACAALGEQKESEEAYDRQLELDPDNPLARIDRATIAINVGDYATATAMAMGVLHTKARGEALHTLALVAYRESRHEQAIDLGMQAIKAGVQDPEQVKWNMSLAMHAIGRYEEGWELAECRGTQQADQPMRLVMNRFAQPALTRAELHEPCRLHVHHEMGNGDAIAMARYLDLLVEIGHDVRLETVDSMVELHRRSFPDVSVMGRALDYPGALGVPPFDRHVTTLSLPCLFGTRVDSVPWSGPYLKPDPQLVRFYQTAIRTGRMDEPRRRRIGFCWSSGIRTDGLWISHYGRRKSMHFGYLMPLINKCLASDRLVSLQIGPERAQLDKRYVQDVLPEKPSWDETAALVSCLDAVVTVDTAVAHLAGALGVPTLLLMQRDGSTWHFMCERPGALWNERSPWYPSIRIIRQTTPGDWSDVVTRAAADLSKFQELQEIAAG